MTDTVAIAKGAKIKPRNVSAEELAWKAEVAHYALNVFVQAQQSGFTGPVMDAMEIALNDLSQIGPEKLRNLALDVRDREPRVSD